MVYLATVTTSEVVLSLPRLFDDQQLTVVLPTGKVEPDAGVQATGRSPSILSFAVAVNFATAPLSDVAGTGFWSPYGP